MKVSHGDVWGERVPDRTCKAKKLEQSKHLKKDLPRAYCVRAPPSSTLSDEQDSFSVVFQRADTLTGKYKL